MKQLLKKLLARIDLDALVAKNWLLKVISLFLAVTLWLFVGGEDRIDKNVMVPIEIINLPRNLVISNQFKKEIEVSVSGPRSLILEMGNRSVTRQIDLSTATPGTMVIENSNQHIPVPRGVTVQRVQPSSIILSLDKLVQKQLAITPRTTGRLAAGYYLKALNTDPDLITITGPETVLAQVEELFTRAISLEGLQHSTQLQVPLQLDANIIELIGEPSVTADLQIALETTTRSLEKVPVVLLEGGDSWTIEPPTVKIIANIPELLLLDETDPQSLFFVTAIAEEGESQLRVRVIPRPEVELPIEILLITPPIVELVPAGNQPDGAPLPPLSPSAPEDEPQAVQEPAVEQIPALHEEPEDSLQTHLRKEKSKRIVND
jgi:hypothetical protein